jgi:hypothetical protein
MASVFFLAGCSALRNPNAPLLPLNLDYTFHSAAKMGISFPPVTDTDQRNACLKELKNLNVNKIRFAENWKTREAEKGAFNWGPLDERIAFFIKTVFRQY